MLIYFISSTLCLSFYQPEISTFIHIHLSINLFISVQPFYSQIDQYLSEITSLYAILLHSQFTTKYLLSSLNLFSFTHLNTFIMHPYKLRHPTQYHFRIFPLKITVNQSKIHAIHPLTQYKIKIFEDYQLQAQLTSWTYAGKHDGVIEFEKEPLSLIIDDYHKLSSKVLTLFEIDHKVQRTGDTFIHKVQKQQIVGKVTIPIKGYIDKFQDFNAHYFQQKLKLSHEFTLHYLVYLENTKEGVEKIITEHQQIRVYNLLNGINSLKMEHKTNKEEKVNMKLFNKLKFIQEEQDDDKGQEMHSKKYNTEEYSKKDNIETDNKDNNVEANNKKENSEANKLDWILTSIPLKCNQNHQKKKSQQIVPQSLSQIRISCAQLQEVAPLTNLSQRQRKTKLRRKQTFLQQILKMVIPKNYSIQQNEEKSEIKELTTQINIYNDNPQNQVFLMENQPSKPVSQQSISESEHNQLRQCQKKTQGDFFLNKPFTTYLSQDKTLNAKCEPTKNQLNEKLHIIQSKCKRNIEQQQQNLSFKANQQRKGWNRLILCIIGFTTMFISCILLQSTDIFEEQSKNTELSGIIQQFIEEEEELKVKIMAKVKYHKGRKSKKDMNKNSNGVRFTFKR